MKIAISSHPNVPEVTRTVIVKTIEHHPTDPSIVLRLVVEHTLNEQPWPMLPDREVSAFVGNDVKVHTLLGLPGDKGKTAQPDPQTGEYPDDVVGEYSYLAWMRQAHGDGTAYSFCEVAQAIAQDQVARLDARDYFNA